MNKRSSRDSRHLLGLYQRGFSLLELMFTVAILAILLGVATPSLMSVIRNNKIVSQNNEFISALNYARSESIRRGEAVTLCSSTNGTGCAAATTWGSGWITFVDLNANGTLDGVEVVMQKSPPVLSGFQLNSSSGSLQNVRFSPNGMLGSAVGEFTLQKTGCTVGTLYARKISLNATGRVATTTVACT